MTPGPLTDQERAEIARRRERRARQAAQHKRECGEGLLASLFERSADAHAAMARLAEGTAGGTNITAPAR